MILLALMTTGLLAQESPVLLTIGDEKVNLDEFERIYRKNNNESSLNKQSPEEYLELFINFKIKVKEAEALGMDTTSKFINELEGYRKQLAKPYLVDEEAKEEMMRELKRLGYRGEVYLIKFEFEPMGFADPYALHYGEMDLKEIAREALKKLELSERDRKILELFLRCGSIRRVAVKLGGLSKRKEIRDVLRRCYEALREEDGSEFPSNGKDV